jgi:hypothetical protein
VRWLLVRKALILTTMMIGGLAMWTANPVFWLWLTAKLESGTSPGMGPYGLMLVGIVGGCVAIGRGLSSLNRRYARLTGSVPTVLVVLPWRRSVGGGRDGRRETDGRLPVSVLDIVMVVSVVVALATFGGWLAITNPTPPNIGGPGPAKR